jgi:DNA-binding PadR family transcriptional regulator
MEPPITARAAALQVLDEGPAFGLEIIERVRTRTHGVVEILQGSLYPALRGLENDGFVILTTSRAKREGRPRIYVELTETGRMRAVADRQVFLALSRTPERTP